MFWLKCRNNKNKKEFNHTYNSLNVNDPSQNYRQNYSEEGHRVNWSKHHVNKKKNKKGFNYPHNSLNVSDLLQNYRLYQIHCLIITGF